MKTPPDNSELSLSEACKLAHDQIVATVSTDLSSVPLKPFHVMYDNNRPVMVETRFLHLDHKNITKAAALLAEKLATLNVLCFGELPVNEPGTVSSRVGFVRLVHYYDGVFLIARHQLAFVYSDSEGKGDLSKIDLPFGD